MVQPVAVFLNGTTSVFLGMAVLYLLTRGVAVAVERLTGRGEAK